MKTIIVPTDFSPTATNATHYAMDMALAIHADILLFHTYQLPLAIGETPLMLLSVDEMKDAAETKLAQVKKDFEHAAPGKIQIHTESRLGNLSDELEDCCNKNRPFCVIMGTQGHSAVERVLFGSNTLSVIKHLTWPVICVPTGKEYATGIKKIGMACDFREVKGTTPTPVIKTFVKEFNAELHVLNVDYENRHFGPGTPHELILLKTALQDLNPQYHYLEHKDIEDGINEFAETNNLDLVITIPKKHKLMEGLFKKSSSRQLVFQSHIPVMCIHE